MDGNGTIHGETVLMNRDVSNQRNDTLPLVQKVA
jgi:hypothetical protein